MDNLITGAISVAMFLAFAGGLAESIGEVPFICIVAIVSALICTDFYQSAKAGLRQEKEKNHSEPSA